MKHLVNYLLIMSLLATVSCSKERFNSATGQDAGTEANEKSITLKVAVPYTAPTRAIGAIQENTIETLDLLAFKVDGGTETFLYRREATKAVGNTEGSSTQSFNVKLLVKDYQQRFVLVSNARSKLETFIGSRADGWVGYEKEGMLSQLTVDLGGGDRWNATGASNYTAIPMWGQCNPIVINSTTNTLGTIQVLRMIAKIEVALDESVANLTSDFKLKSVHLYNTNTSGRVVPNTGTEYFENMTAKKASLPASVVSSTGPIAYTDFGAPGVANIAMRGAIYLFETAAKNEGNLLEETCIVVGGLFETDAEVSYYRLDFLAQDAATHLDILRNHSYTCNITAVKGRGHPTVDDAFRAKSFNMIANIIIWNGNTSNIIIDGTEFVELKRNYNGQLDDRTAVVYRSVGSTDVIEFRTNISLDNFTLALNNGGVLDPMDDKIIKNDRFMVELKSENGINFFKFTALEPYADEQDNPSILSVKAGRIEFAVTIIQSDDDPEDWGDGGNHNGEF